MSLVYLAVEDKLSDAVGRRLILDAFPDTEISSIGFRGNSYLKSKVDDFLKLSKGAPVIMLTDLDNLLCPQILINDWFRLKPVPDSFIFRVAIHEIEAWLLADHKGMKDFMGPKVVGHLPRDPDAILDPKTFLLNVTRKAKREVRADILQEKKGQLRQGFGYNERLSGFVAKMWCPVRASEKSESLKRAISRISFVSN